MDIRMETDKGKGWLLKEPDVVIFEMNALSNSPTSKLGIINDMHKMANFLIDTGICKKHDRLTLTGVPFLSMLVKDKEDDNDQEIDENKLMFDEWLCKKYLQTKENASKRGIKFSLSLNDLRLIMRSKRCKYSGILFDKELHKLSLDRIDCKKGYTKDNVVACSEYVNKLKSIIMESPEATKSLPKENIKKLLISLSDII